MQHIFTRFLCVLTAALLLGGCASEEPMHEGKSLSQWLKQLDDKQLDPHTEAVEALVVMGHDVLPVLASYLDHVDTERRCGVATVMLRLDPQGALPQVRARLASDVPRMRLSMCLALVRANVEPGLAIPVLAAMMNHEEYFVRNTAIKALGDLGPQSIAAVPALTELLRHHGDADVRQRAAFALVRIGPGAVDAVPALCEALRDSAPRVREGAASALAAIGPAAKAAEEPLREALSDSDAKVRFRAGKALEVIAKRAERAAN